MTALASFTTGGKLKNCGQPEKTHEKIKIKTKISFILAALNIFFICIFVFLKIGIITKSGVQGLVRELSLAMELVVEFRLAKPSVTEMDLMKVRVSVQG